MPSTFMGIEIGKRGVMTHSQALHTTGHNLANAETEGYSRQRVDFKASKPIYNPSLNRSLTPGQLGQGVEVTQVARYEDILLEGRIVEKGGDFGYWSAREKWLNRAQALYNENTTDSIRHNMDVFFNSWSELAGNPDDLAFRHSVVENSQSLMDRLNGTFKMFDNMRNDINTEIVDNVRRSNELMKNIASLSVQIVQSEALGDNPNDLKDQRDVMTRELSEIMNIEVEYRDKDEFTVTVDGKTLIQGKQTHLLRAIENPQNRGLAKIIWDHDGSDFTATGGTLASLIQLRDEDIRGEIQKIDTLAISFIDQVNEIHSKSFDLEGNSGRVFFEEHGYVDNLRGSFDSTGDGAFDSSYLFRVSGTNKMQMKQQLGFDGTMTLNSANNGVVNVNYRSTDTVEQVIDRINQSGSEVLASLNSEGQLIFRASSSSDLENPDFVIRHIEDSGEFLVGFAGVLNQSGAEGSYDWQWAQTGGADGVNRLANDVGSFQVSPLRNPSGWIGVNEDIVADVTRLAASENYFGQSSGEKNGSSATAISSIGDKGNMVGRIKGYREFYGDLVSSIGSRNRRAIDTAKVETINLSHLDMEKKSITSVNMDEELTNMLKFQHGYAAASRFITQIDKMLDIIINRMGV